MLSKTLKSAYSKIARAIDLIGELERTVASDQPFTYILETNTITKQRATYAMRNERCTENIEVIAGDVIHNLHAALDHAYWEIVSPFATTDGQRRNIQFPFSQAEDRYPDAVRTRLAHKVSNRFLEELLEMKAHGGPNGDQMLYLMILLDTTDKHRTLNPTGDFKSLSRKEMTKMIPDFPQNIDELNIGSCNRDVVWRFSDIDSDTLGPIWPPSTCIYRRELNVPVDIQFSDSQMPHGIDVFETLNAFVGVANDAIEKMRSAANAS